MIPQDGIYGRLEEMDAVVLKLPQTREGIRRLYGKRLEEDSEAEPEVRTLDREAGAAEDMETQYVAYYRNDRGGVGKFSWVNDTVLEDMEDYEARRLRRCVDCRSPVTDRDVIP